MKKNQTNIIIVLSICAILLIAYILNTQIPITQSNIKFFNNLGIAPTGAEGIVADLIGYFGYLFIGFILCLPVFIINLFKSKKILYGKYLKISLLISIVLLFISYSNLNYYKISNKPDVNNQADIKSSFISIDNMKANITLAKEWDLTKNLENQISIVYKDSNNIKSCLFTMTNKTEKTKSIKEMNGSEISDNNEFLIELYKYHKNKDYRLFSYFGNENNPNIISYKGIIDFNNKMAILYCNKNSNKYDNEFKDIFDTIYLEYSK